MDPIVADELYLTPYVQENMEALTIRPIVLAPPEAGVARTVAFASLDS